MPRSLPIRTARLVLLLIGVFPSALIAPYLSTLGITIGTSAVGYGDALGVFFFAWVLAGIVGLATLVRSALRFGSPGYHLGKWETLGISLGILACVPFAFAAYPRGAVPPRMVLVYLPVCMSATAGFFLLLVSSVHRDDPKP